MRLECVYHYYYRPSSVFVQFSYLAALISSIDFDTALDAVSIRDTNSVQQAEV